MKYYDGGPIHAHSAISTLTVDPIHSFSWAFSVSEVMSRIF